ncbi:hypothetical protein NZ698_08335 [Chryseobacterium sp. PBS4-4]|uniref:Lipoprotein n=1 Tax=Chryseobacterium edaphi TaxID=2976532 RepID=A0ABT2W4R4_9FLAO|nr:hypothetical protein [Chryseobacterium edaphi]MCU7617203.1 hypothetical protein [Chryseobacterium edaphi]
MKSPNYIFNILSITSLLGIISCNKPKDKKTTNIDAQKAVQDSSLIPESKISNKPSFDSNTVEDSLALKIKDFITSQYLKPEDLKIIDASARKFNLYQIDLNNDDKKEVFINFFTPYFCGSGGCTLVLLDSDLKLISKFTVTRTPITIDSKTENGWKVLWIQDGNDWKILTNKSGKYPSNPSMIKPTKEVPESNAVKIFDNNTSKTYSF